MLRSALYYETCEQKQQITKKIPAQCFVKELTKYYLEMQTSQS